MTLTRRLSLITGLMTAACVLLIDAWSKWHMLEVLRLTERPPVEVLPFFNLVAVWNPGISFGLFASYNQPLILSMIATVIVCIMLIWLARNTSRLAAIAIGMVIGGATGNVIDRARFGKVFDFLDFYWHDLHWPAFNIADSGVVIGVVLLCIHSMFYDTHKTSKGTS